MTHSKPKGESLLGGSLSLLTHLGTSAHGPTEVDNGLGEGNGCEKQGAEGVGERVQHLLEVQEDVHSVERVNRR
jgi:hypothetical protein